MGVCSIRLTSLSRDNSDELVTMDLIVKELRDGKSSVDTIDQI